LVFLPLQYRSSIFTKYSFNNTIYSFKRREIKMRNWILYWFLLLTPLTVLSQTAKINTPLGATVPFNSNPSYTYGTMPTNLPTGGTYTKSQDAANAYAWWVSNYVVNCGGSPVQYRVKFDDVTSTVSEGIAYGMLIAAYAADKEMFDGFWSYYKANSNGNGLMHWKINGCSGVLGSNGASDADEDAAMALIIASCQWPTATTPYTYATEATNLITAVKNCEIDTKTTPSNQMSNGDGWIGCNSWSNLCRNPSYMAPAYYKEFASFVPAQAGTWNAVVTASYNLLNSNRNGSTGLVSNWSDQNGNPNSCNGPNEYGYDACRNPWRMATDVIWHNDANANDICNKLGSYVISRSAAGVGGPVPQWGGGGSHNATFVSTFASGIVGATPASTYQSIMNDMYTEAVNTIDGLPAYFGNTLRVISLFMMTGNFWKPCPSSLPVRNFMLHGIIDQQSVKLEWSANVEDAYDYFEVQKSFDGENYFKIETVKVQSNSNNRSPITYSVLDLDLPAPTNYYRIVQYHSNGNSDTSEVISVQLNNPSITISPNPFESEIRISILPAYKGYVKIKTLDITGQVIFEMEEDYKNEISIDNLFTEGIYFIEVITEDKVYMTKAIRK
jgi:endo-1,4-beta-D-glucanase Y